jgi:2'-5' RNA ligase
MRLFFAVDIDRHTASGVDGTIARLKAIDPSVKWVRPQNHHITLYFFGETDERTKGSIEGILDETTIDIGSFTVRVGGISAFPSVDRPRVIWVGIDNPGGELAKMHASIGAALRRGNFPVNIEERVFAPHLTIGRVKERCSPALIQEVKRGRETAFGEFRVGAAVLYRSVLWRDGALYTPLKTITLS